MDRVQESVPKRPPDWQPLVSPREWAILAHALADCQEVLDDLHIVLTQLSPGVRRTLVANLVTALQSGARPRRAVWTALAITGGEVRLCSAVALGRLHALADDSPAGTVHTLWPKE
ncbi:MAG: hypothetical protein ACR2LK_04830 [Solirubrobacteraceae bacterium]